jgi:hypothetical protein
MTTCRPICGVSDNSKLDRAWKYILGAVIYNTSSSLRLTLANLSHLQCKSDGHYSMILVRALYVVRLTDSCHRVTILVVQGGNTLQYSTSSQHSCTAMLAVQYRPRREGVCEGGVQYTTVLCSSALGSDKLVLIMQRIDGPRSVFL